MNDAQLDDQLRALHQPPPDGGFEARLQQALWAEAQVLRVQRAPARPVAVRRLLRWGGRTSVGVAVVLGVTAAAAAGGIWAVLAERASGPPAIEAAPESEAAVRPGQRRADAARGAVTDPSSEPAALIASPGQAIGAAAVEPVPAPVPVTAPLSADEVKSAARGSTASPSGAALRPLPVGSARRAASSKTGVAAPAPVAADDGSRGAVTGSAAASPELLPFDLPERGKAAPESQHRSAPERGAPSERSPPVGAERRALPELPGRGEERRARPDRERERGAWPPGREIARERSGRDNAERGLERAREARERK
ncbi:MAG: hypothetical protein RL685_1155 [Pseudomonadota bacterium]|jgi:hypothetical protein